MSVCVVAWLLVLKGDDDESGFKWAGRLSCTQPALNVAISN